MKKLLRAEIYSDFLKMGQAGMPVDGATYSLVQTRLADLALCGKWAQSGYPPLPQQQQPRRSSKKRSRASGSAAATEKAAAAKAAKQPRRFEVECIVEEGGAWALAANLTS